MQQEPLQEQIKDPRSAVQGKIGGQIRMAQLDSQERSTLARHAARPRWHPLEAKAQRERAQQILHLIKEERAQEIVHLIKEALKDGG